MQNIKTSKNKGITLIEVMVSLVFLSTGLIPLFGVVISSINLSVRIKSNLVAANLAQEGVEIVRALRDKAWMDDAPFNRDLTPGNHLVSWDSDSLLFYNPNSYIKFNSATGIYSQTTGIDTIFKRRINIVLVPSTCNCEVIVTSNVSWLEKSIAHSIVVEGHLFDWKQ